MKGKKALALKEVVKRHPEARGVECKHEEKKKVLVMFERYSGMELWQCKICKDVWSERI